MPSTLEAYRVFIASPGGLKEIRECFRSTIEKYNEADSVRRGAIFIPVGWEATLGGVGRPQRIINDDLSECDYCVLVLHDRWGTPASTDPDGPTGTQEEFELALKLHSDPDAFMRQVIVFFVAVEAAKMSDPGPQLQKVLDFRKQIEAEKKLLYHQIEGEKDFADVLRGHLAQWVRDHESRVKGSTDAAKVEQEPKGDTGARAAHEAAPETENPIAAAKQLADQANFTEAESLLATAAAKNDNPAALFAYAQLLARLNRRRQAAATFENTASLALEAGQPDVAADALTELGRLRDDLAMGDAAEEAAQQAIDLQLRVNNYAAAAKSHILLGERRRRIGNFAEAEEQYRVASDLAARGDNPAVQGDAIIGLSEVYREQSRLEEAREALCKGIAFKQKAGIADLGDAYAALGAILEGLGDEEGADKHYRMSLDLFRQKGDRSGLADAADHLAQICLRQGKAQDAEDAFRDSAATFEVLQNIEGAADAYLSLGRLQAGRGAFDEAEASFRAALSLAQRRHGEPARELQAEITSLLEDVLAQESPSREPAAA
jgi:tetratricopeptide (TPR) repeat protein